MEPLSGLALSVGQQLKIAYHKNIRCCFSTQVDSSSEFVSKVRRGHLVDDTVGRIQHATAEELCACVLSFTGQPNHTEITVHRLSLDWHEDAMDICKIAASVPLSTDPISLGPQGMHEDDGIDVMANLMGAQEDDGVDQDDGHFLTDNGEDGAFDEEMLNELRRQLLPDDEAELEDTGSDSGGEDQAKAKPEDTLVAEEPVDIDDLCIKCIPKGVVKVMLPQSLALRSKSILIRWVANGNFYEDEAGRCLGRAVNVGDSAIRVDCCCHRLGISEQEHGPVSSSCGRLLYFHGVWQWAPHILEFIFRQGLRYRHADVKAEEKHHTQLMENLHKMLKNLR